MGLEAASTLRGVRKPEWVQSTTWTDDARGVVWRADEVELISSPTVAQLLQCANAIRIAARRGTSTPLSEPATAAARALIAELTIMRTRLG